MKHLIYSFVSKCSHNLRWLLRNHYQLFFSAVIWTRDVHKWSASTIHHVILIRDDTRLKKSNIYLKNCNNFLTRFVAGGIQYIWWEVWMSLILIQYVETCFMSLEVFYFLLAFSSQSDLKMFLKKAQNVTKVFHFKV